MAIADATGETDATIPGIAKLSGVSIGKCEAALKKFQEPDPYSRSRENEGRRIEKTERGWRLLNYVKYRNSRDEDKRREYMRNYMKKYRHNKQE